MKPRELDKGKYTFNQNDAAGVPPHAWVFNVYSHPESDPPKDQFIQTSDGLKIWANPPKDENGNPPRDEDVVVADLERTKLKTGFNKRDKNGNMIQVEVKTLETLACNVSWDVTILPKKNNERGVQAFFLYREYDELEIDIEIFYGTESDRKDWGVTGDDLCCMFVTHPDGECPKIVPITLGEHTLHIDMSVDQSGDSLKVVWSIDGAAETQRECHKKIKEPGMGIAIHCSAEQLPFSGSVWGTERTTTLVKEIRWSWREPW